MLIQVCTIPNIGSFDLKILAERKIVQLIKKLISLPSKTCKESIFESNGQTKLKNSIDNICKIKMNPARAVLGTYGKDRMMIA